MKMAITDSMSFSAEFIAQHYAAYTKDLNVEVRYIDPSIGKGLFAKKEFHEGEIVLVEKPFLVTNIYPTMCDYCFKADTSFPCKNRIKSSSTVCYAHYCSEECRERAFNQYHALECWATNPKMKPFFEYCNERDLSNAVAAARACLHSIIMHDKQKPLLLSPPPNDRDDDDDDGDRMLHIERWKESHEKQLDLLIDYKLFHSDDLLNVFPELDQNGQYEYFVQSRQLLKDALYDKLEKQIVDSFLTEQLWRRVLGMFALNRQVPPIQPFSKENYLRMLSHSLSSQLKPSLSFISTHLILILCLFTAWEYLSN
jgi:hypothetical protein